MMIQAGMGLPLGDSTEMRDGLFIRTDRVGGGVFVVSATKGHETVLDATNFLKSFGWLPTVETRAAARMAAILDAIDQCELELDCVDREYADADNLRLAARRAISNCILLLHRHNQDRRIDEDA